MGIAVREPDYPELFTENLEKGRIDTRVLELLAPHFSDRFPNENWMIYDKKRQKVLAHEQGGECTVYIQAVLNTQETDPVQSDEYENLWKAFCSHITICLLYTSPSPRDCS